MNLFKPSKISATGMVQNAKRFELANILVLKDHIINAESSPNEDYKVIFS